LILTRSRGRALNDKPVPPHISNSQQLLSEILSKIGDQFVAR